MVENDVTVKIGIKVLDARGQSWHWGNIITGIIGRE